MRNLYLDIKFGLRLILRNPGFSGIALLVLALGIGTNTAAFTIINILILRPPTFEEPERLVACYNKNTKSQDSYRPFSYPNYLDIRDRNTVFSDLTAQSMGKVGVWNGEATRSMVAEIVSANYFRTLGVPLLHGRPFTPSEEKPGAAIPVVIVSYEYWKQAGRDPNFVGKSLMINNRVHKIVGIAPEGFSGRSGVAAARLWVPLGMFESTVNDFLEINRPLSNRDNHALFVTGRLKPGVTAAEADNQLAVLAAQLAKDYPRENENHTVLTHRITRFRVSISPDDEVRLTGISILLAAMAGLVLLIACFNLANMMLARGTARRKEFAVRLALGCSRRRLLRQLIVEGLLLSALGTVVGFSFSVWGNELLLYSLKANSPMPIRFDVEPDSRVFLAMLGFCLLSTLLFSAGPAWRAVKYGHANWLKEGAAEDSTGGCGRRLFSSRNLLVMGQLALSLALLTAAGLLTRGALKAGTADPGYSLENGILVELDAALAGYDEVRGRAAYRRVQEALKALPGVASVSPAAAAPFGMVGLGRVVLKAEDAARDRPETYGRIPSAAAVYNLVGAEYFRTLGVPLLRGRGFSAAEEKAGPGALVAVIDPSTAKKLWPGEDPLGKRIAFRNDDIVRVQNEIEVVGVVPTLRDSLRDPQVTPHVYVPFEYGYQSNVHFHVKMTNPGPSAEAALMPLIRRAIRSADGNLLVLSLKTMRAQFDGSMDLWLFRTGARAFLLVGGLALFLAVIGVYGLKAYAVSLRAREIGIRTALGASMRDNVWLVLKEGLWLIAVSACIGLALSLLIGRVLSSLLYEVGPLDPVVLLAAPLLLAAVSLWATWIPARRAARVDPLAALRSE